MAAWTPEPLWTFRGREKKTPTSAVIRTPGRTARVLIDIINRAIAALNDSSIMNIKRNSPMTSNSLRILEIHYRNKRCIFVRYITTSGWPPKKQYPYGQSSTNTATPIIVSFNDDKFLADQRFDERLSRISTILFLMGKTISCTVSLYAAISGNVIPTLNEDHPYHYSLKSVIWDNCSNRRSHRQKAW